MVGCGIYLAETPRQTTEAKRITAPEVMTLVREGATLLQEQGEKAYTEFRKKESKWFQKDTYLFVFSMEGTRVFHAAEPETEGRNDIELKDIVGRPFIRMFIDAVSTPSGEGWVHYMWPLPGDYFPTWKSSFVKQVTYPSGKQYFIGSGIYNMQMDRSFIEDVVNRAAALLTKLGRKAFDQLRDKTGPFVFMDTYVFVDNPDGVELVNPALPSIEGKNLLYLRDAHGQLSARNYIDAAMNNDSAWVDYYWYRPGKNTPAHKFTYVRKVQSGGETFVLGAGYYVDEDTEK
jgi:signal transduction histidine kinase